MYIADNTSSRVLAPQAVTQAIKLLKQTQDTTTYLTAVQAYNSLPGVTNFIEPDTAWIEQTQINVASETERLDVELKSYLSNMIKESTRVRPRLYPKVVFVNQRIDLFALEDGASRPCQPLRRVG